ncbi:MAG: MBL fold metallo-hydrolase [Erysipelotrichaceae bacterium]|nr:MBL fold metallo-hydrolase [Erysipelotrichaceae bacterium]
MKLTVIVDNNSLIDYYYLAEPALSFYLEDGDKKILFDTGYSDVVIKNAEKMGIDLSKINTIVLSHGHNDHTGGLVYLQNLTQDIDVYCCPNVDEHKEHNGKDISSPIKLSTLPRNFKLHISSQSQKISEHLTFLGEIERNIQPLRKLGDDPLYDDSAILFQDDTSISIITGCSHSGICNIVEQAKNISKCANINIVIGGFHLLNNEEVTKEVCDYFSKQNINAVCPCHCTDLYSKIALSKVCKIKQVGVSTSFEL